MFLSAAQAVPADVPEESAELGGAVGRCAGELVAERWPAGSVKVPLLHINSPYLARACMFAEIWCNPLGWVAVELPVLAVHSVPLAA